MREGLPLAIITLGAALLLGGCGPTEMEAGQAVLMTAPVATLIGALFASGFATLWQPLAPGVRFDVRPSAGLIGLQLLVCLGIPFTGAAEADWLVAGLWFAGTSYLTLQCICLRLALISGLRRHYTRLSLAPWLLLYGQALWLGYLGSNTAEAEGIAVVLWILPGYLGLVTGPLLVILLVEVTIRRKRLADRIRETALPRPLPEARIL